MTVLYQDIGDVRCVRTSVTVGASCGLGPGALVGGVGRVVGDVGDAFGRPVVLDQDLAVDVGEGDGGDVITKIGRASCRERV